MVNPLWNHRKSPLNHKRPGKSWFYTRLISPCRHVGSLGKSVEVTQIWSLSDLWSLWADRGWDRIWTPRCLPVLCFFDVFFRFSSDFFAQMSSRYRTCVRGLMQWIRPSSQCFPRGNIRAFQNMTCHNLCFSTQETLNSQFVADSLLWYMCNIPILQVCQLGSTETVVIVVNFSGFKKWTFLRRLCWVQTYFTWWTDHRL